VRQQIRRAVVDCLRALKPIVIPAATPHGNNLDAGPLRCFPVLWRIANHDHLLNRAAALIHGGLHDVGIGLRLLRIG